MNKEKVLLLLKTRYSNLGFSNKAFDGVADYLFKTVTDETQIETAINGVQPLLKAFQGDIDKVRTEKSELQKKYEELKKQKVHEGAPSLQSECNKSMPEWFVPYKAKQNKKSKALEKEEVTFKAERDRIARQSLMNREDHDAETDPKGLDWLKILDELGFTEVKNRQPVIVSVVISRPAKLNYAIVEL